MLKVTFIDDLDENNKPLKYWHTLWQAPVKVLYWNDFIDLNLELEDHSLYVIHDENIKERLEYIQSKLISRSRDGRIFGLFVSTQRKDYFVSDDALTCKTTISFPSHNELTSLRAPFKTLVSSLDTEIRAEDWGSKESTKRIKAIWDNWEHGQSEWRKKETFCNALRILIQTYELRKKQYNKSPNLHDEAWKNIQKTPELENILFHVSQFLDRDLSKIKDADKIRTLVQKTMSSDIIPEDTLKELKLIKFDE